MEYRSTACLLYGLLLSIRRALSVYLFTLTKQNRITLSKTGILKIQGQRQEKDAFRHMVEKSQSWKDERIVIGIDFIGSS